MNIPLARFATESGKIANSRAKARLFEPNRKLETSVFRTAGMEFEEIKDTGIEVVREKPPSHHSLYGWATFPLSLVDDVGLEIKHDDDPLSRHSNITGWPQERERRKEMTLKLAAGSDAIQLPSPVRVKK